MQIVHRVGKQLVGADAVELQQLICVAVFPPCHRQQQMLQRDFPAAQNLCLPRRPPEKRPGLAGQPLGQGQLRRPHSVKQPRHRLRQIRVHTQKPKGLPRRPGFPRHHQQQMGRADIAVSQGSGQLGGALDQVGRQYIVMHGIPPA